ncbi:prepilin peptidase [Vibrio sp. 10N.286.49.C2]|uniref:SEC-C metal-binding domain-containing protein n=1 Tax=unclassified Vibrio TaxID=2614977 RepID=UPI000C835589|nr:MULTISPECIES: SEC-C metal-binding domain-containing protein [unclassified Vibrio]PMH39628.1 prepilin peptidase [Vibrio sp. 10N.286.49.C2]PMH57753.1 prepilin peptidase [Vibrio sp. 10N.286.49.B1]PMH81422.1 prepilin peptidase [Vibrio sp. 10N.286.48.B7]
MNLIQLPEAWQGESADYLEGAILAANFTVSPLEPSVWLASVIADYDKSQEDWVVAHLNAQYAYLKANQYSLLPKLGESRERFADFAQGFMVVWEHIEPLWLKKSPNDGTMRMLQAWLTTLMLAIDEEQTHAQMTEAGFETLPQLEGLIPQVDHMINEIALAADEMMIGHQSQSVNPFKDTGRNDPCPCESGKKYKKCCGK